MPAAREAFIHLLSIDPDQTLDPFLVPPPIVEFFDQVRADAEPELAPLRERKRQLQEQERLAEEARRRLLAEEHVRSGPPSKVVVVEEHIYMLNFLPFGVGQFQNGDTTKGIIIAVVPGGVRSRSTSGRSSPTTPSPTTPHAAARSAR